MGDTLKLNQSHSIEIRRSEPELLEVEADYAPGGDVPPAHLHPAQDEHFEVLSGSMRVRIDGEERTLDAGDELDVPRDAVHQMWNPGPERARVLWRTTPRLRTEEWFRTIDAVMAGREPPGGVDPARMLEEFSDVFRLAP